MVYLWFVLTCFFAWRVWLYRSNLQDSIEAINDLEHSQNRFTEALRLKNEETDRLNDQIQSLQQELDRYEIRDKETRETMGILAKQWEGSQQKHDQTAAELATAQIEVEHYKNLATHTEQQAKAVEKQKQEVEDRWRQIEKSKQELDDRWQEVNAKIKNAEHQADHIIMMAQEEVEQITYDIDRAKKEKKILLQSIEKLEQEIEALNATLHSAMTHDVPNGAMMDAVTNQLNHRRGKSAPNTIRRNPSDMAKEEVYAAVPPLVIPSAPSKTLPAAGVAIRSEIVRPATGNPHINGLNGLNGSNHLNHLNHLNALSSLNLSNGLNAPNAIAPQDHLDNANSLPKDEEHDQRARRLSRRSYSVRVEPKNDQAMRRFIPDTEDSLSSSEE